MGYVCIAVGVWLGVMVTLCWGVPYLDGGCKIRCVVCMLVVFILLVQRGGKCVMACVLAYR